MGILVTGGLGFIGSHTTVELLKEGNDVIIVDNLSNSSKFIKTRIERLTHKKVRVYFIDLLNKQALREVFMTHHIKKVIHFAGCKAVAESITKPLKYYVNNVVGTLNLCEVMNEFNVFRFIFSSSATVYGVKGTVPLTEEAVTEAINPYGKTKLYIEAILKDLSASNDKWKISLFRYFNPVGAHPSGELGEMRTAYTQNLIPTIMNVITKQAAYITVYGGDYNTTDGTCIRDYIHVQDLARGHILALEDSHDFNGVETFNLGTGRGYTVLEVIRTFETILGERIPYKIKDRRPGDIAVSYSNPTKAMTMLQWKAEKGLYDMCHDVLRWEMKQNMLSV